MHSASSDFLSLLDPTLAALGWNGTPRQRAEAMPAEPAPLDLDGFRSLLARLGYGSRIGKAAQAKAPFIRLHPLPELVLQAAGVGKEKALIFAPISTEASVSGFRSELRRFMPLLVQVLLMSLLIGLVGLAPTFYNMAVYDHILGAGSAKSLPMLLLGGLLALGVEMGLRGWRTKRLSHFGARLDHVVGSSVLERLLTLPPVYTERASPSAQLARLRDFESVREFFTGPLAALFFEMPLVLIYAGVMAMLSGWLVLVPMMLLALYALVLMFAHRHLRRASQQAAALGGMRQELTLEIVSKQRALRLAGFEEIWLERYRQVSAQAAQATFRASYLSQLLETVSYGLMTAGGVATLGFGVMGVMGQSLSVGALVASMMLVWRIVAPMQFCCSALSRIQQMRGSVAQIDRLLAIRPEFIPTACHEPLKLRGRIAFHRVTLRYAPDVEPALLGVTFDIAPGQIVAIKGGNGSGKSTLLKLILGLYIPQGGSVRMDGVDLRQLDPIALRQSIAYVPQSADFFPGTLRDQLLFAEPGATEAQCHMALEAACAWEDVMALPQGLDTPMEVANASPVSFLLRQRLNLARAYLRHSAVTLFDEASHSLGEGNDAAFERWITAMRGRGTLVLVTHREDHMRMANTLLVLKQGELTHAGPPAHVFAAIQGQAA